jgi:predicted Fe-Mo cluster-binding NifX family protein
MKIGVITDDNETISAHFGRARYCAVFELVDGALVSRELRDKPGHADHEHDHDDHEQGHAHGHNHVHFHDDSPEHLARGHGHGHGHHFQEKLAVIADCQVLLARGMGRSAYERLQAAGIEPLLVDEREIETAVQAYLDQTLTHNPRRLH